MNPVGLIIVACGVFSLCGAGFNWEWFINSWRARPFVALFGRTGARVFYALLGLGLVVLGALMVTGLIPFESAAR